MVSISLEVPSQYCADQGFYIAQSKVKDIELKGHTDCVDQLCWDPKHPDTVATAAADKSIRLWDARSKWFPSSLKVKELRYPQLCSAFSASL